VPLEEMLMTLQLQFWILSHLSIVLEKLAKFFRRLKKLLAHPVVYRVTFIVINIWLP